ncbi:LysR family transcriptional regulator [Rossellomorea vietnamensis]|uniref:LysR family transcriptional regulator n=1 Tax=Rossellomorea vietnamensis TaxID=218284 RepID=UPI001CCAA4B0|nr:LysR family transcriptional regulator [Rossellomorea vietnamensis]MCA0147247.1 LysR family transcriptional regulator [Rossellomorea vietnamensis]
MEINQLIAFELVARLGSYSKASRYLDVSQPTVSLRVKELEKDVGGYLFVRAGKQMELTDLGKGFLPYARQALEVLHKGKERALSIKEGKRGEITIGTLPTFTSGHLTSIIKEMYTAFPDIQIAIHTGHNQQIIDMLYDGTIRMGMITSPFFNKDLKKLYSIKEPLIFVARCDQPLSGMEVGSYRVEDIFETSKPYILTDWSEESKHWQRTHMSFGSDTIELPPATALEFVQNYSGTALLTESMVSEPIEKGTLVKLEPNDMPALYREVALVSLGSEQSLPPAARRFLETVRSGSWGQV